jgi:putative SOS response-associated peptidase YedK
MVALHGFLTTEPNEVLRPVHSKAMPVILTEPAEWDADVGRSTPRSYCRRPALKWSP